MEDIPRRRQDKRDDELAEWERFVFGSIPSVREKRQQVLQDVADGLSLKEIALKLGTSEQVVKNALRALRQQLECATTVHAIATAIRRGLID